MLEYFCLFIRSIPYIYIFKKLKKRIHQIFNFTIELQQEY